MKSPVLHHLRWVVLLVMVLLVLTPWPVARGQDGGEAPSFSRGLPGGVAPYAVTHPFGGPAAVDQTLTQSLDPTTVVFLNSVSCNAYNLGHAENSYFRAFQLANYGITEELSLLALQFGIDRATSPAGTQPVFVYIYENVGGPFPGGQRFLIYNQSLSVANQEVSLMTIPLEGKLQPENELVVEIRTPDGQEVGNFFFIGSNAGGQTAPSYIQAAKCGQPNPIDTEAIQPGMHIVMTVFATTPDPPDPTPDPSETPAPAPEATVSPIIYVPHHGLVMVEATNPQVVYDGPRGQPVSVDGRTLTFPADSDGNGFDTYVVTNWQDYPDGETWVGVFMGSAQWLWLPSSSVIPISWAP